MFVVSNFFYAIAQLLGFVLNIYFWIVVVAIIFLWIPVTLYDPTIQSIRQFLHHITTPVFEFFSKICHLDRLTTPLNLTLAGGITLLATNLFKIFLVRTLKDLSAVSSASQIAPYLLANIILAIAQTLYFASNVYLGIIIVAVILSWIPLDPSNMLARTITRLIHSTTEPVFNFFRRTFRLSRWTHPLDFTPMIVIIVIYFFQSFAVGSLMDLAIALR